VDSIRDARRPHGARDDSTTFDLRFHVFGGDIRDRHGNRATGSSAIGASGHAGCHFAEHGADAASGTNRSGAIPSTADSTGAVSTSRGGFGRSADSSLGAAELVRSSDSQGGCAAARA
jgi:hypothetical protein